MSSENETLARRYIEEVVRYLGDGPLLFHHDGGT